MNRGRFTSYTSFNPGGSGTKYGTKPLAEDDASTLHYIPVLRDWERTPFLIPNR